MSRNNVVLITVDSLRADHLGCYGYKRNISPSMDALASKGLVFSRCMSNSGYTLPSIASLLTSAYPLAYGGFRYLSAKRTLVAEVLKENGYTSAAFVASNPFISSKRGFDRGFDTFEDFESETSGISRLRIISEPIQKSLFNFSKPMYRIVASIYHYIRTQTSLLEYVTADRISQRAMSWAADNQSDPLFLWLHYMDTHIPYGPAREYPKSVHSDTSVHVSNIFTKVRSDPQSISRHELETLIHLYDGAIQHIDHCIGSLVDQLNDLRALEKTYIIITSDHGEEFQEHGGLSHFDNALYEERVHVPLVIVGPGIERRTVKEQVSLIDLAPTILDLLQIPEAQNFQGRSLLPIARQEEGARDVIIENEKKTAAIFDRWKYIYTKESGEEELYDLEADPRERVNLYTINNKMVTKSRSRLETHQSMIEQTATVLPEIELEEKIKERLRMLGYME